MAIKPIILLTLPVLILVACSGTTTPTADIPTTTSLPPSSVVESPLSPPATPAPPSPEHTSPLPDPASSPIEPPSQMTDQAVAAAKTSLAEELGVTADQIEVTTIEPVEWPDASLGCPKPGKAYAQVITPGYRIVLEIDGKEYELHTDESGRAVVICERKLEKGPAAGVAYLADELGIPPEEIDVLTVEMYEWPDTSLGCPETGQAYAQVVTTGYRIILKARGEKHEVHTDKEGQIIVMCDSQP